MSLWCPYIKANYCFLWSCNKYILRHPVAKGADCFQERTRKHVLLVTGKGPRQSWVSHPGSQQHTLQRLPLHRLAEKGKGLGLSPGPAPQIQRWWVGARASGRLGGGRPAKPSALLDGPPRAVSQLSAGYQLRWLLLSLFSKQLSNGTPDILGLL